MEPLSRRSTRAPVRAFDVLVWPLVWLESPEECVARITAMPLTSKTLAILGRKSPRARPSTLIRRRRQLI
jgi:hypothetical protein